jgi:hypothetical protein
MVKKGREGREVVRTTEIIQVEGRVGRTAAARLQWVLDFARRPLEGLTDGDWSNLRRELVAFHLTSVPPQWARRPKATALLEQRATNPETFPIDPVELPSRDDVRRIQEALRRLADDFLHKGEARIPPLKTFLVGLRSKGRFPGGVIQVPEDPGVTSVDGVPVFNLVNETLGQLALLNLLVGFDALVRECPEPKCRRWFVAGRRNQLYCGVRCQTRAATRAWRKAHGKTSKTSQKSRSRPKDGRKRRSGPTRS